MTRALLPNRRPAETFDLEVGGLHYTATIGRFADGHVAEVFLSNHKINSAADVSARDRSRARRRGAVIGGSLSIAPIAVSTTIGSHLVER
jgi:hypothetical protein